MGYIERFVPGAEGEDWRISEEHFHRYYSVLKIVENKKVIDIASGEGYGSSILADAAESVVGIDIDEETVKYANEKYCKDNLVFKTGNVSDIPADDSFADVVISFETIEHVNADAQQLFFNQIKRVLKNNGILVISTPNKEISNNKNSFHQEELTEYEFVELCKSRFKHVVLYYQDMNCVSVIRNDDTNNFAQYLSEKQAEITKEYMIAVCSDSEIPENVLDSVYMPGTTGYKAEINKLINWGNSLDEIILDYKKRIAETSAWGDNLDAELKKEKQMCSELSVQIEKLREIDSEKEQKLHELSADVADLKGSNCEKEQKIAAISSELNELKTACAEKENELEQITDKFDCLKESYIEKEQELKKLADKMKAFAVQYESIQNKANSLESELLNIRSSKYYRVLAGFYKKIKKIKNKLLNRADALPVVENDSKEKVSIIVPVYNNKEYLRQCFDSLVAQTYSDFEIVAIDDCSTQPEVEVILEEYKNKYDNFFVYKNDVNSGISVTTNNCMIKATGEWIAMVDCDDWLEPDAVEKLMQKIMSKKGAKYGYTDRFNYNNELGTKEYLSFSCRPTENYHENLLLGMYTCHLKIIHKDVFRRIGLHDPYTNGIQDYDVALKAAFYFGDEIFAYLPEAVYNHRIHSAQTTQTENKHLVQLTETLKNQARQRMDIRNGIYDKFVSFIIISFEKMTETVECIKSIEKTVKIPHEIILFDNGSCEETVKYLKKNLSHIDSVKMIFSKTNLNCGGGRREAVKYAKGDYLYFFDNDIIVSEEFIVEPLIRINTYPDVASVTSRVIFPNGTVQFNGMKYDVDGDFITFSLVGSHMAEDDLATYSYEFNDWCTGGATLFKKEVFCLVTGLEEYPNAFEDNETGYQLKNRGYKLLNCPASTVLHNHIQFDEEKQKKEKRYMDARYASDRFVESLLVFYRRNKLIIKDEWVLNKMGISATMTDEEITKRVAEYDKTAVRKGGADANGNNC